MPDLRALADEVADRLRTPETDFRSDIEDVAVRAILMVAFRDVQELRSDLRRLALRGIENTPTRVG